MHHAWVIVGLVFTTQFVANALGFYAFGIMLTPIADEFGVSRMEAGLIPTALSAAGFVLSPLLGRAATSVPIRLIMGVGAAAMAAGFYAMTFATAFWHLVAGYAVAVSLGLNGLQGVVSSALLVNWFQERRALAIGIAGVGVSSAGFVMTPITSGWVESLGWRGTFVIFAAISAACIPLVSWLATTRPSDRGDQPYGASAEVAATVAGAHANERVLSTREALRIPALWLIAAAAGIAFSAATAIITHLVALGRDAGYDASEAAILPTVMAGMAAVAKLFFGGLAERIGEKAAFATAIVCQIIGLAGLVVMQQNYPALVAASGLFGLGYGGIMPMQMSLIARVFGATNFGPVAGLAGPILVVFQAIGAPALGYAYDVQGSYDLGLWILCAVLFAPVAMILAVRERPYEENAH